MMQFGDLYSQVYDLLYKDKNYLEEVEYVNALIKSIKTDAKTLLDIGCGTGRHAELFCELGYIVYGVDMSRDMLEIAERRRTGKEDRLKFIHSKIQDLNLSQKFDVVVSLFHVVSYQTTNDELIRMFKIAKDHMQRDGLFIFDFWYGPAVLTNPPSIRVKRIENEEIKITRIAEPQLYPQKNLVEINYDIFVEDKRKDAIIEGKEVHRMRYFFDTELEMICEMVGFKVVNKYKWLTYQSPDFNSWYVAWGVVR